MRSLDGRPALLAFAGLAVGIAGPRTPWLLVIPLAIAAASWFAEDSPSRWRWRTPVLLAIALLVGWALSPPPITPILTRTKVDFVARVTSVPRLYADSMVFQIRPEGNAVQLRVRSKGVEPIVLGELVRVEGEAGPLREGTDATLLNRGIAGLLSAERVDRLEDGPFYARWADAWRRSFVSFCDTTLTPRTAVVVDALCFNVDTLIAPDVNRALSRSGTIHIVSASGMHVFLLTFALLGFFKFLPVRRGYQMALVLCVLLIYSLAAGLNPPIVRSVLMAAILLVAYQVRRQADLLSAIGVAGTAGLLIQPWALFDVGFQLSFAAIGALALYATPSAGAKPWWGDLAETGKASLAATLGALPITASTFGIVSLVGPVANVLLMAVMLPLMVLPIALQALSLALPSAGDALMQGVVDPLAGYLLAVVSGLGNRPWSAIEVPMMPGWAILLYYAAALAVWRPYVRPA